MFKVDAYVSEMPRQLRARYPFGVMKVGESFLVPSDVGQRARGAAQQWKLRFPGWNFSGRTVADGYRIWRTA